MQDAIPAPGLLLPNDTSEAADRSPRSRESPMYRALQARLLSHAAKAPIVSAASSSSSSVFSKRSSGGHGGNGILYSYSLHCSISKKPRDLVKVSPTRKFSYGFSSCSKPQEISDLTIKKCVPCNSKDIQPMSDQSANELLQQVQGWNLVSEGGTMKLLRSLKVKSFTKGLELFQLVGDIAEAEGHHPDLHLIGWNNVKIEIWTHSAGGLTENDFILAAKINSLNVEQFLRKKADAA